MAAHWNINDLNDPNRRMIAGQVAAGSAFLFLYLVAPVYVFVSHPFLS